MYKNLFGVASVISSIGFLIWSIGQATAFPQGPSVNLGTNPIENLYGTVAVSQGGFQTIWINNTSQDLIIKTAMIKSYCCRLAIDDQDIFDVSHNIFYI